ncbi:MAG: glycine--tRNA ligase subunit beta, partial [Janthinobacterium lividum]
MTDFLLELLTEEIPARMQPRAIEQLRDRFAAGLAAAGLGVGHIASFVTPRRLVLHATGLDAASTPVSEERRGPRIDAPEQAIAGFVKSTGLARDAMEERDTPKGRFLYATIVTPGRGAEAIIADLIPAMVRDFDWPKSMRWGDASTSAASPRWVRPLSGIIALLDDAVVAFAAAGVASGRTTFGHRFMSSGPIEIRSPASYADQLRAAHIMLDAAERRDVIVRGARDAATAEGLTIIPDDGLVAENAGLTEWPVPLLGRFDPAFLDVPREVIQLTMRTNQKYFACTDAEGNLAPAFVCVANIEADDGGAAIVAGNQKVLAARLSDAKFFWDADVARVREGGLASFTPKLADIVFHEKLGTVADKVERVAKLARWLVASGAILPSPPEGEGRSRPSRDQGEGEDGIVSPSLGTHPHPGAQG